MRVGVTLPAAGSLAQPDELADLARHAEGLGFDSVWVTDHIAMPLEIESRYPYGPDGRVGWDATTPWLDPLLALAWVASATSKLRLGTSVIVAPLRHPVTLAKQVASLDYLSGGRVVLGVGAGWLAEEFRLVGQEFPQRYERLAEQMRVMRQCWKGGREGFSGRFYELAPFDMAPAPAQGIAVPMLVGGEGPAALRLVADVGDGWHPTFVHPELYARRLGSLSRLMERAGRDVRDLELTARPGAGADADAALVEQYDSLGVRCLVFDPDYSRGAARAREELSELAKLYLPPADPARSASDGTERRA